MRLVLNLKREDLTKSHVVATLSTETLKKTIIW